MLNDKSLKGIGIFSLEIIGLISAGFKEDIEDIENHFETMDIVEYLNNKYDEYFFVKFDNKIYNNQQINRYFNNYISYIQGRERRKYGIKNNNDGLLLILALITDKVEEACINWSVI